ncbi:IS66-like element accessory protein TnpA [Labrys sp. ZIDIC5]|uniref:IS66-like element accessory protein TnpA n=1 Tax=Labrys sedimenti TaxID=3106036 RepID=UPI002ACAEA19|nr:transposase [Labrys sp. ZIDIC5]MDZ5454813.1 transposase [Labrys sp. ZIDIC5]
MTISELTLKTNDEDPVRRFEVFTGSGRRREWSEEEKARIVAESYEPGASVSGVARHHTLSPQQLFTWRRAARRPAIDAPTPLFAAAVITTPTPTPTPIAPEQPPQIKPSRKPSRSRGIIELEIEGVPLRVDRGADAKTVAAVIRALKATS